MPRSHPFPRARPGSGLPAIALAAGLIAIGPPSYADSPFLRAGSGAQRSDAGSASAEAVLALGPRTVTVRPGSNTILELAVDHLNRIVTPFARPSVRTVASLSTEVDGNVLYVATAEETPATLYISDADDARTTIGLTLAPRRVPPREIRLRVPGVQPSAAARPSGPAVAARSAAASPPAIAATWRQPQRYVEALTAGFRALALGAVPDGYSERRARAAETPTCGAGLGIRRGRAFDGGPLRFVTARVRVRGGDAVTVDARTCRLRSGEPIAALALWPSGALAPGAEAELLVAVRRGRDDVPALPDPGRRP
jgi:conjugal transfer pilus assembly protein TraK